MNDTAPFSSLLLHVVDNRGRTCPESDAGLPLIATNCVKNSTLFPTFEKVRFVSAETYQTWFRGHPLPGDMIFVLKGAPGQVCLTPDPVSFCIAQDMVAIRADPQKVYPNYLFAALRSKYIQNEINNMHVGTMIPHFKKGDFDKLHIPIPSRAMQEFIGDTYLTISRKIDLNRRMNETLEAMARAIFKDWFVDFGPTRSKMAGRAPYLAPEIWSLFPERLDGESVPSGWRIGRLDEVAEITMGASPDGSTYNDQGIGTPLVNGPVEYGDFFLRRIKWTTAPSKLSRRGDLIFCVRGSTTGRLAFSDGEYCLGRGVASIRGNYDQQGFVDACIVVHLDRLLERTTGSVFPNLSSADIRSFGVLMPHYDIRKAYCDVVRPLRTQIWANVEQSEALAHTRDLLLPKLMSGEIRIKDIEKIAEAAA